MADLIDRDSAIKKFIEGVGDDDFTAGYNLAVGEYRRKIAKIPSVNRWIPCSERFPEKDISVIIYAAGHRVSAYYDAVDCVFRLTEENGLFYRKSAVTHWMPMPEPPEKE